MSKTQTVLVVDGDGSANRAVRALEARGYGIVRASDGWSALWMARRARADVILVDLSAPGAFEFLEEKARDPELAEVPLLIVTVFAEELRAQGYSNAVSPTMH
jgi:CheY-like chemotaxis protein